MFWNYRLRQFELKLKIWAIISKKILFNQELATKIILFGVIKVIYFLIVFFLMEFSISILLKSVLGLSPYDGVLFHETPLLLHLYTCMENILVNRWIWYIIVSVTFHVNSIKVSKQNRIRSKLISFVFFYSKPSYLITTLTYILMDNFVLVSIIFWFHICF